MNLRKAKIIFLKEMLETLRDKRTLFIMILGPVLVYPMMIIVMVQLQLFQKVKIEERVSIVEIIGGENAPEVVSIIKSYKNLKAIEVESELDEASIHEIRSDSDLRLIISKDVDRTRPPIESEDASEPRERPAEDFSEQELIRVTVVHDAADFYSRTALEMLDNILEEYSRKMIHENISVIRRNEFFRYPMITREVDISTATRRGGDIMGNLLPMILIMMTIAGAMHPAIDTTAGEKERGTIETILTAPASMSEIVLGKFFSVFVISMTTGVLNLLGIAITFSQFLFLPKAAIDFSIQPITFLLIFLFLIPLAFLFGALMMAIATYARTFKEAQSYVSILYIICIFPAMLSTTQGFELSGFLNIAPVINLSLLFKELMHQKFIISHILLTFISTSFYAAMALWLTVRLFHRESVLFSSEKPFALFVRRSLLRPKEKPTPAEALFLIAIAFVLLFALGSFFQARDIMSGMVYTQLGLILVPTLLFAWYLKLDFKKTFSIRRPGFAHFIGCILLGFSSVVVASVIDSIQKIFYDPSKIFETMIEDMAFIEMGLPLRLVIIALLPALCEETLFRGFILSAMSSKMRAWKAILFTGILFGFFHILVLLFRIIPVTHIFLGIILSYVVYRSGSIFTGILMHLVYNGTIAVLIGLKTAEWISGSGEIPVVYIVGSIIMFLAGIALTLFPSRSGTFDSEPSSDIMN